MGFNSVYLTLQELFPQEDTRVLKAVAIEHAKDPDSAVEYVLNEVLPRNSKAPISAVENNGKTPETSNASPSMSITNSVEGVIISSQLNDDDSVSSPFFDANDTDDQVFEDLRSASTSLKRNKVTNSECGQDERSCVTTDADVSLGGAEVSVGNAEDVHQECSNGSLTSEQTQSELNLNAHPEVESDANVYTANVEETDVLLNSSSSLEIPDNDDVWAQSETLASTIMTRSGQVCRVDLLEDIIKEAKNYKETVCSSMESLVRLMEEVDLKENEAEQAKAGLTNGGLDILEKVEEIKKMLVHAKEANDMHAGEVYGEKSILATEVKELQARLLGLSDEKDKSLSMLDEMRGSLEKRLAVAEEQKKAAEKVMLDEQEIAQAALVEQELIMDKVVQESKLLQQEADQNAKLRDFLVEKGQLVDVLQGEISVICQDVKLLEENFDKSAPLRMLLSIQKPGSHLGSSNSSVKSSASLKSMNSLKSTASLSRSASLKSAFSSKSSISQKSTASDMSNFHADLKKFQPWSFECEDGDKEVEEKFLSYEATAEKLPLDEDWELCYMN